MNAHYPNAAASLMGHPQLYDDSALRKRVMCLMSGLLICFVIGVAAIGVSVIVLLKFEGLEKDVLASNLEVKISDLHKELRELRFEVEQLHPSIGAAKSNSLSENDENKSLQETSSDSDEDESMETSGGGHQHHHHGMDDKKPEASLCDDSDLCMPPEGSGHIMNIEDALEGFSALEGTESSDDCIQFARPVCPEGVKICFTNDKCPIPMCCDEPYIR